MTGTIGFGIVGCGMIARFHARAIAELKGARLRAVATASVANGQSVLDEAGQGGDIHESLDELLARPDIHVLCICTPSGAHLEPALAAAKAGKHVVVEKPLEVTLRRCDRIIDECARNKVRLATIFPSRFADANMELKKAMEAGRFGQFSMADTTVKWWRTQQYYDAGGWRGTWELDGGGALMNQAIHNIDLLQWIGGPIAEICGLTALRNHVRIEVEDTAAAILRFRSGAIGVIQAATSAHPGLLKTIGVYGSGGSAVVEQDHLLTWAFEKETKADQAIRQKLGKVTGATGGAADPKAISHEGHRRQLADFVRAIRDGGDPLVDGAEGRKAVEIILAIYHSMSTGRFVKLPLAKDPTLPKLTPPGAG
jgi:predicted dehydrogenase